MQLNSAKFKTLHEVEKKLEFQFYIEEWKHLGGGKDAKKYYQLTYQKHHADNNTDHRVYFFPDPYFRTDPKRET